MVLGIREETNRKITSLKFRLVSDQYSTGDKQNYP